MDFIEEVFEIACPKCERNNQVTCYKRQNGFSEPEEFFCAYCGFNIGSVGSADEPITILVG